MRVLIISDAWHPQVNGVVRTYEYLCDELITQGHKVEVIGPASFAYSLPMPFYPEIKLVIKPYKRLKQMIEDFAPDKIHIATEGPLGWAARKYCHRNAIDYTTSYHTQFPDYVAKRFAWLIPSAYDKVHAFGVRLVRRFHERSSAIFIATKSLENQLLEWDFKTKMTPLTRGVDERFFKPRESDILQEYKQPIALYVGRIAIEKNLEAFLDMKWSGSKVVVGDGPLRNALQEKYGDVLFTGKKTGAELAAYYQASDVFVFPSRTDTFGIVLIEALACGLPIAAYDVTGPKDIVIDERLGALDEDLSVAAARAMEKGDPTFCAKHIKDNYSWKTAGKQFVEGL